MTKNPLINASCALGYILLLTTVFNIIAQGGPKPDSFLAPAAFLSLFTFSAAFMGYVFCSQPIMLYLDGKKSQAVSLFMRTIFIFGGLTAVVFAIALTGIFPEK